MTRKGQNQADTRDITSYRSSALETPKSDATKRKWLNIYYDYANNALTEMQLAEQYGLCYSSVSKIIKWAVHHLHKEQDPKVYKAIILDRLRHRQQELDQLKKEATETRDKVLTYREQRLNDRLIAQVQSILSKDTDDSGNVQVNVQINNLDKPKTVEAKVNKKSDE